MDLEEAKRQVSNELFDAIWGDTDPAEEGFGSAEPTPPSEPKIAPPPETRPAPPPETKRAPPSEIGPVPRQVRFLIGEELVRETFREAFPGETFASAKSLDWLGKLELDGFSARLKLAFEYQGPQHFKHIEFFHPTLESFEAQQVRDRAKVQKCLEAGVALVVVPDSVPQADLRGWVRSKLESLGFTLAAAASDEAFQARFRERQAAIRATFVGPATRAWTEPELKTLVESAGYTLRGWERKKSPGRLRVLLHVTCPVGHETSRLLDNFRLDPAGRLEKRCTVCFHAGLGASKRNQIGEGWDPRTGLRPLEPYVGRAKTMKWECKRGHLVVSPLCTLLTAKFPCTQCWIDAFEAANDVKLETAWDPAFKPTQALRWRCGCGGTFQASKISIFRKKQLCRHCGKVAKREPLQPVADLGL